jgi:gamma-glutamyl hercynylcysteine S-oxide synthase
MKKRKEREESIEIEEVKLKPIAGIEPPVYLAVFYSLLLALALIALFVVPAIVHGGSLVQFRSSPAAAAVFVDDIYVGSTPADIFVSAGNHSIRIEKPFFARFEDDAAIPRRLFGSLFFPKKLHFRKDLELKNPHRYAESLFSELSNWALSGSFHHRYHYPSVISPAVSVLLDAGEDTLLEDFIAASMNNLATREIFSDWREARTRWSNMTGRTLSGSEPEGMPQRDLFRAYRLLYSDESADSSTVPEDLRNRMEAWIEDLCFEEYYAGAPKRAADMAASLRIDDHRFLLLPGGERIPLGMNDLFRTGGSLTVEELAAFPHTRQIRPFYILDTEVSRGQFARFLEENPEWNRANSEELLEKGLVTTDYLIGFEGKPSKPVSYVSWYAAKAYAAWLQKKLPAAIADSYSVRLPDESEWEYAARLNGDPETIDISDGARGPQTAVFTRAGRLGIIDLRGNLWEWNENWYFPSDLLDGGYGLRDYATQSDGQKALFAGREKAVRGGSWANDSSDVKAYTRASLEPNWCTPFTGFRLVLAPKE